MMYLRSLIFNILFYGVTAVLAILALPTMLLPAAAIQAVARFWGLLTLLLLRIVGATHRVSGEINHGRQVIYAAKHQSAWETIVLSLLLREKNRKGLTSPPQNQGACRSCSAKGTSLLSSLSSAASPSGCLSR